MGTRRKARECSLQMMFAADFSGFSDVKKIVADYWREFGFDQINNGTTQQVRYCLEEIENLEILTKDVKTLSKKVSQIRDSSGAVERYEETIWKSKRIAEIFCEMIRKAVSADADWAIEKENLERAVHAYKQISEKFFADLKYWMREDERYYLMHEYEAVNEAEENVQHILEKLNEIIENVSETIEEAMEVREFADRLVFGTVKSINEIDEMISQKAEHWKLSRMASVDRNVLRLAIYEMLYEETPRAVVISEALESARRFSSYEAAQFVNGLLDAIKHDIEQKEQSELAESNNPEENLSEENSEESEEKSQKIHQIS